MCPAKDEDENEIFIASLGQAKRVNPLLEPFASLG
jgi:hypothetical protein